MTLTSELLKGQLLILKPKKGNWEHTIHIMFNKLFTPQQLCKISTIIFGFKEKLSKFIRSQRFYVRS